jgi:uncharacterized coiled-coil protein SlyX
VDVPANSGSRHLTYKNTAAIGDGQPAEDAGADADPEQATTIADLRRQIAASEAARAENEAALAVLTEQLVTATPTPALSAPAAPEPPPERPPWQRADAELAGLAIIARESPEKAGRAFWRAQVDALGRHLAPDESPTRQVARALDDERGHAFVEALQSRPA